MTSSIRRLAALAVALALPLAASAADYKVDTSASNLGFSWTFQGATGDGSFKKFDAAISYDPANLSAAKFVVDVDLSSAATGNGDYDKQLASSDFFEAAKFPKAHYETTGFAKDAAGNIVANGKLTLHGITKPVTLKVVEFKQSAGGATLSVAGQIKRLDFGVGSGDYKDTSTIADEVKINARLGLLPK